MVALARHGSFDAVAKTSMSVSVREPMNQHPIPISTRLRHDIAWQSQVDSHSLHPSWTAADPLTRRIFRCSEGEYRLLHWLDGEATLESLRDKFNAEFAPQTIELQQVRELIAKCNQSGLLRAVSPKQNGSAKPFEMWPQPSDPIHARSNSRALIAEQMRQRETNWFLMFIRWLSSAIGKLTQMQISLGSPDRWLVHVAPKLGWLYSSVAVFFWLGLLGVAVVLICLRLDALWSELPDFQSLRSPALLIGYGTLFMVTRVIHELGHAVVCKRAEAACKDAGLIVSWGMLCPYVDITDAWRIGSRSARMGIALAGIYTECVLAFFAAIVWLTTHPGLAHELGLQTMLVCTVTTLLFNANPLMKYDGYFVLCDWLNTQKLREKAFEAVDAMLDGRSTREPMGMSLFLVFYFLASTINRGILIVGLVSMVYFLASQSQLAGVGLVLIVLYGCCSAITTMAAWTSNLDSNVGTRTISRRAAWLGWTAVSLLIAWAVNMPLPSRVHSNGTFQLGQRQPVYPSFPGRIDKVLDAKQGMRLERGDRIVVLENPAIQKSVLDEETRWIRLDCQLKTHEYAKFYDDRSASMVPRLEAERAMAWTQLEQKRGEQSRLTVSAPIAGWFEPAIAKPAESLENPADVVFGLGSASLDFVSSYWTSDSSIGRLIDRGTLIGWIVYDKGVKIECALTEEQVSGIGIATEVRVCIAQEPTTIFAGRVVEIATMSQTVAAPKKNWKDATALSRMTYQVRIQLNHEGDCSLYSNGKAEIVFIKPSQSILQMALDTWMRDSKMR